MNRFYDIEDGKIRYDGININKIKKSSLRRALGVVFGASVDDSETGYALTADEVNAQIGDITQLTHPVDTGECVAH